MTSDTLAVLVFARVFIAQGMSGAAALHDICGHEPAAQPAFIAALELLTPARYRHHGRDLLPFVDAAIAALEGA